MKKFLSLGVFAAALLLVGCGSSPSSDGITTSVVVTSTTSVEESTPSQVTNSYTLIGGGSIDLTRGPTARPIALWFWAPG